MTDRSRPTPLGSRGRGDLLLPVLAPARGPLDPVAIATWHLALSDTIRTDLPHELLGLWLFPSTGGVVLLGPAALVEDALPVTRPKPFLTQEQLLAIEERVRRAGYQSVIAAPIRGPGQDLGLMLLAALAPGQYGPIQAMRLFDLLRELVGLFGQLAEQAPTDAGELAPRSSDDLASLVAAVARIAAEAPTANGLLGGLSAALHGTMPHDELLVLVPAPDGKRWQSFGGDETGGSRRRPTGGDHGRFVAPAELAPLLGRLRNQPVVAVADLSGERDGLAWPVLSGCREVPRLRAMIAAALASAGELAGILMMGSVARDLYRPPDETRLRAVAGVIGPAVAALVARGEAAVLRRTVAALEGPGEILARVVRRLATVANLGTAIQEAATLVQECTGASGCRFALRLGPDDAVILAPGETRPLLDLPLATIEGAPFAPVLRGEVPLLLRPAGDSEELILPLRIAGRPFGALILTGEAGGRLAGVTLAAQQLADAVAPHLELARREAGWTVGGVGM